MADEMLLPYPGTLNLHAVSDVAGYFRGTVEMGHAVHAAWELLGLGLSMGIPDPGEVAVSGTSAKLPKGEEAAKLFDALKTGGKMKAIDWKNLLSLLLSLISQWLSKTGTPAIDTFID